MACLSFLHNLLIYSITCLYQYKLMNIYFQHWIIIKLYFIFLLTFIHLWPWEAFSVDSCVPLIYSIIVVFFYYRPLTFRHYRRLQDHLVCFFPRLQNQLVFFFFQEVPQFLLLEIKIQVTCSLLLKCTASGSSKLTKRGTICVNNNWYILTYL